MWKTQEVCQENIQGVPMFRIVTKVKKLKNVLKDLNKEKFVDVENVVDEAYKVLLLVQQQVHGDPQNIQLHRE